MTTHPDAKGQKMKGKRDGAGGAASWAGAVTPTDSRVRGEGAVMSAVTCPRCGLLSPHDDEECRLHQAKHQAGPAYEQAKAAAARFYREAIVKLYGVIGADRGECRSCGRPIWWVTTKAGEPAPYTLDATSHACGGGR